MTTATNSSVLFLCSYCSSKMLAPQWTQLSIQVDWTWSSSSNVKVYRGVTVGSRSPDLTDTRYNGRLRRLIKLALINNRKQWGEHPWESKAGLWWPITDDNVAGYCEPTTLISLWLFLSFIHTLTVRAGCYSSVRGDHRSLTAPWLS